MGATVRKALLATTVAAPVACLVLASAPAYAAPVTDFQMPFPCGQEWTGTTRPNHSPSPLAVDWNRIDDVDDPVVASAPGTVVTAEPSGHSGYGSWVRLDHGGGEATVYAHLSTVAVVVGQTVDQGALLGTVGSTGHSSGPHLHFEERDASGVVAPYFDRVKFAFGTTLVSDNCVDVPLAGNFLAGPEAEVGVFRRAATSTFQVQRADRAPKVIRFGATTDQPVVGDWDGDGRVNAGVRTPGTRTFTLRLPEITNTIVFGKPADLPVAGDWDGDGIAEVGVRRSRTSSFLLRAADGTVTTVALGDADDLPVTGDWDGDLRTDVGVYDVASATFTLRVVDADGLAWTAQVPFGEAGNLPVTGDWDANGKTDVGVWDPETGVFSERVSPAPTSARVRSVDEVAFGNPR